MIDPKELRIGNYVRSLKNDGNLCFGWNLPFWEVTIDDMLHILNNPKNYDPIPLTEDWLINFGFYKPPHFTINNSYSLDIGRSRKIVVGDIGTPNLMIAICGLGYNNIDATDVVIMHNWDYDKEISVHKFQNLIHAISGQELIYNENHK